MKLMLTISAQLFTGPSSAKMAGAGTTSRAASASAFVATPGKPGPTTANLAAAPPLLGGGHKITRELRPGKPLALSPLFRAHVLYRGVDSFRLIADELQGGAPGRRAPGRRAPGAGALLNKRKRPKTAKPVRFRLLIKKKHPEMTTTERIKKKRTNDQSWGAFRFLNNANDQNLEAMP